MATPLDVLIVEDSPDDAELILRELRRAGFIPTWKRVETEPDFAAELKNAPDIVLSDFSMPQFSGLRAAELLQESGLNIPFILISGTVGEDVAVQAMKHGATDYLLKDRIARLGAAVEHALEQKRLRDERQRMDEELRRTHEQLREVLAHSPAVIYSLKVEGERVIPEVVSANIIRLLGFTVEESCRFDWWGTQLHPEDKEPQFASISETLRHDTLTCEYRVRHKDGHYIWVEDVRRTVRDTMGKPVSIAGAWTDITERKRAAEEIQGQLDELQRWHEVMLDREERILELKHEVNELLFEHLQPARYSSSDLPSPTP